MDIFTIRFDDGTYDLGTYRIKDLATKLGQLEDIEEELGIDLITLFKALRNGIYTQQNGYEKPIIIMGDDLNGDNLLCKGHIVLLKDYGKTWALTKEEIENESNTIKH